MNKGERNFSIKLSGVNNSPACDGKMICNYLYVYSKDVDINKKEDYEQLLEETGEESGRYYGLKQTYPILLNYVNDNKYSLEVNEGPYFKPSKSNYYSIYKREYERMHRLKGYVKDKQGNTIPEYEEYELIGRWQPVVVDTNENSIRDFNISSGSKYQYIIYPGDTENSNQQQFANAVSVESSSTYGAPVLTQWDDWCITELQPQQVDSSIPLIKKSYKVDLKNVWRFKYNLETGEQVQNLSKNELQSLGQFSKITQGRSNSISGNVTCLLGSEIIPYSKQGYIERRYSSVNTPLSVNEKISMLKQWREFCYSKNPKLLRDKKGQCWIVQILSNTNTPMNHVLNQPDSISFSWKEIESMDNVIIYGGGEELRSDPQNTNEWIPY